MSEMAEIRTVDVCRRYPDDEPRQMCVEARIFSASLTNRQRILLARLLEVVREEGEDLTILQECCIQPWAIDGDNRQARFVVDRQQDARLYSHH